MFSLPTKSDQNNSAALIQQCLANYDYSNATLLAEELLLKEDSEENKGLLADCYLAQQENHKAYFLLKNTTSSLNAYKFAVACIRLNGVTEAETVLTREQTFEGLNVPNGAFGLQLLATVYKKQNKTQQAREYYEKALQMNPKLVAVKKQLKKLGQGISNDGGVKEAPKELFNNRLATGFGNESRVEEAPKGLFDNHPGTDEVKNQPVRVEGVISGKGPWSWEAKKEDQSPKDKSFELVDSPGFMMDPEFDEQGYGIYALERKAFVKKFSFPEFLSDETAWIHILKQKNAGEEGDYVFWYRSKRVREDSRIEKEHSRDVQYLIRKFDEKVAQAKERSNCMDLNADMEYNIALYKKDEKLSSREGLTNNRPPVDQYFDVKHCEVYSSEGKFYSKLLNQSNVNPNNNKYYILQILQSKIDQESYFVFFRWGRIGAQGQWKKSMFKNPEGAMKEFEKKRIEKVVKGDYHEVTDVIGEGQN